MYLPFLNHIFVVLKGKSSLVLGTSTQVLKSAMGEDQLSLCTDYVYFILCVYLLIGARRHGEYIINVFLLSHKLSFIIFSVGFRMFPLEK